MATQKQQKVVATQSRHIVPLILKPVRIFDLKEIMPPGMQNMQQHSPVREYILPILKELKQ
jgi:hypothetical protein